MNWLLFWVSFNVNIPGNEEADKPDRYGGLSDFTGPEPAMNGYSGNKQQTGFRHTKMFLFEPRISSRNAKEWS